MGSCDRCGEHSAGFEVFGGMVCACCHDDPDYIRAYFPESLAACKTQ